MVNKKAKVSNKPQRSLRSILTLWFLLFSVVPLAFVTGYSLIQFETAISGELNKRLQGNARELAVTFQDLLDHLEQHGKLHATDTSLVYYLSTNAIPSARRLVTQWMQQNYPANRISLFDRTGRLVVSLQREAGNTIQTLSQLEGGSVYLADHILKRLEMEIQASYRDIGSKYGLEVIVYTKVVSESGRLAGYIEENINVDDTFLKGLKKRLNLEITLFDRQQKPVLATNPDFLLLPKSYFAQQKLENGAAYFEVASRGQSYGFLLSVLDPKQPDTVVGLATSKKDIDDVSRGINRALFSVVGIIIILLIFTLLSASNLFLKPLYSLVDAAKKIESGEAGTQISLENDTEIGVLMASFNKMSKRVAEARLQLESKIRELELTNQELKQTQAQLVHSSKMVSLGQLVAGVAHELNNPIAFIYSNMSHLRRYGEDLVRLVDMAPDSAPINAEKEKVEFEYIKTDMPKLIHSCEEGARRVRDIVVGLRNFSRLDEMQLKKVDLEESIRTTLDLLAGEMKNRISVELQFSKVPEVRCYASQLNQVFMNILSNAAQAIEGSGKIVISTSQKNQNLVEIRIVDSGKGISADDIEKIFDPFYTTKPVGQGTGLGLSISYGIIKKHGGEIHAESEMGRGTSFILTLPVDGPTDESSGLLKS
jgi:two-component system NtrC family sensor kinase